MKRPFIYLALLLLITAPLSAQSEFEDPIPPELVEIFLSSSQRGDIQLYSDIPADFPAFDVPVDFEVLGSLQENGTTRVLLRSTEPMTAAGISLSDNLIANGWIIISELQENTGRMPAPFLDRSRQGNFDGVFCHERFGPMSVTLRDYKQTSIITLNPVFRGSLDANMTCELFGIQAEQRARQVESRIPNGQVFEYQGNPLPELDIPGEVERGTSGSSISSGSGRIPGRGAPNGVPDPITGLQAETNPIFESRLSLNEIHELLTEQMLEQEWTLQSSDTGNNMAVSGWTKASEGDSSLSLVMSIERLSGSSYQLRINLNRR